MFSFFKKNKKKSAIPRPALADMYQQPLQEGDIVEAYRYDLGKCRIISSEKGLVYESLETGKQVSWHLMVDAITELQKVKKLEL